jgi:GNAT superfamily N-acetyltransferase
MHHSSEIVTPPIETRRAGVGDLDAVMADVIAGFASYVSFAQTGWKQPNVAANRDFTAEILADEGTWALLATVDGAPVGHVAFMPGRRRAAGDRNKRWSERELVPGLAHLWQLFVLPDWWGRGVAPLLHDAAVGEMRARGYGNARLFTPSLHARARRFYERRGWAFIDEEHNDDLDLTMAEYRLDLGQAPGPSSQPSR